MGCNNSVLVEPEKEVLKSDKIQKEIDALLAEDKENKMLELEYLEQIRIAQENNDSQAFEFFFQEYVNVERLQIPEELKKEPNYFEGGNKVKY
jgi:flagellar biosynthesis/type III secretory pathway chaperone